MLQYLVYAQLLPTSLSLIQALLRGAVPVAVLQGRQEEQRTYASLPARSSEKTTASPCRSNASP